MQGYLYKCDTGVLIFLESDEKRKCKRLFERLRGIYQIKTYEGGYVDDAYLSQRMCRAVLENTPHGVVIDTGHGPQFVNTKLLIVQTLNEYIKGRVWTRPNYELDCVEIVKPGIYESEPVLVCRCHNLIEAVDCICSVFKIPLTIGLFYKEHAEQSFYKEFKMVKKLNELDMAVWEARFKYSVLLEVMIPDQYGGVLGARLFRITEGKRLEELHDHDRLIESNKLFHHTIVPQIKRIVKARVDKTAKGTHSLELVGGRS